MKRIVMAMVALVFAFSSMAIASDINIWVEATDFGSSNVTVGTTCGTLNYRIIAELGDAANQGLALIGFDVEFDGGALDPVSAPSDGSMDSFAIRGLKNPAGYGGTLNAGKLIQVGAGVNTIMNGQVPCQSNADCPSGSNCDIAGTGLCDPVADFPVGLVVTGIAMPGSPQVVAEGVLNIPTVAGPYTLQVTNLFANVITAGTTGDPFYATVAATVSTPPATNTPLSLTVQAGANCSTQSIFISIPPSGAIDARELHEINDATTLNDWRSVELTMSGARSVTASAGEFTLSEFGGTLPLNTIVGASVVASTTVRLDFNDPIDPRAWTVITHNASGSKVCLGFLPTNTNQDLISDANDINALAGLLNLLPGQVPTDYKSDMNRSGVTNGQDIPRMIDQLNGAGAFEVWNARSLPTLPLGCP